MNRSAQDQSRHDRKVEERAIAYRKKGFSVAADLSGWPFPDFVNESRPDIIARKGNIIVIIEVETQESKNSTHARKQARDFGDYAETNSNVSFKLVVV